jgi:hypothetical protein
MHGIVVVRPTLVVPRSVLTASELQIALRFGSNDVLTALATTGTSASPRHDAPHAALAAHQAFHDVVPVRWSRFGSKPFHCSLVLVSLSGVQAKQGHSALERHAGPWLSRDSHCLHCSPGRRKG